MNPEVWSPSRRRSSLVQKLVATLALILGVFTVFVAVRLVGARRGGPSYNLNVASDREKLPAIARNSAPLRIALEQYIEKVGSYPRELTNLFPSYLQAVPSLSQSHWDRWSYERGFTKGYSLYYKLSWDAGLFYEHKINQTNRWHFDPGNGNEQTDLTAELRH